MRGFLALLLFATTVAANTFDGSSWAGYVAITINATEVSGSGTHSNFAVGLLLNEITDATWWSTVHTTGRDIRVTDDEDNEVAHELDRIDTVAEDGLLWVRLDVSTSVDTEYRIYVGNGAATAYAEDDTYGREAVWATTYTGVYHLSGSSYTEMIDATSFDNDADQINQGTYEQAGQWDYCIDFTAAGQRLEILDFGTTPDYTAAGFMACWAYFDTTAGNDVPAGLMANKSPGGGYKLKRNGTDMQFHRHDGSWKQVASGSSHISASTWYFLVGYWDGSTQKIFINGVEEGTTSNSGATDDPGSGNDTIGTFQGDDGTQGLIDECWYSNNTAVMDADWIATMYANQAEAAFQTSGAWVAAASGSNPAQIIIFF
jgi:hypothetical protein